MTAILEQLVGERVEAHEPHHVMIHAAPVNPLQVQAGHTLLQRSAELRGTVSAHVYMHATSLLVPSRLPASVSHRLETSSDPIGRILVEEGIIFTRAPMARSDRRQEPLLTDTANVPDDYLLARTYRLDVDRVPVMVISEWFLPVLETLVPL